jgi:hypothetical protein
VAENEASLAQVEASPERSMVLRYAAMTLYWKNGKVAATDGPYADSKEQLGGILVLEAHD